MAKSETWRDPKAVLLWVMTAVVLFLLIPAAATLAIWLWSNAHPGYVYVDDPMEVPPFLLQGVVGLVLGIIAVVVISLKLRLGLLWLALAIVVTGPFMWIASWLPGNAPMVLAVLLAPVVGALVFKPKPHEPKTK